MIITNSPREVQSTINQWKQKDAIGFVPTMGCLHEGHISLVRQSQKIADKTVVSIFVNPLQFGPSEDFDKYPRTFENDKALLEKEGVDLLFMPSTKDLYPTGFSTQVSVGDLSKSLCGRFRPGHFEGVATVCLKLLNIIKPDFAIFGEKDFQQLQVIRKVVTDLNLDTKIIGAATIREADGLALSSRNRYLNKTQRKKAAVIPSAMSEAAEKFHSKPRLQVKELLTDVSGAIESAGGVLDYVSIVDEDTLTEFEQDSIISRAKRPRLFVAAKFGETRLIDNIRLGSEVTA